MSVVECEVKGSESPGPLSKMDLNCPLTWDVHKYYDRNVLGEIESRLITHNEDGKPGDGWTKYVYCTIVCVEYAERKLWEEALDYLRGCQECLVGIRKDSDAMWSEMAPGLEYVTKASECILKTKMGKCEEAQIILEDITPFEELEHKHQATVWGLRTAVCMKYGHSGMEDSVKFIENALKLDVGCGEWHFLKGKVLGRLRRLEQSSTSEPQDEELKSLERAVDLTNCPYMMVYLAQAYREAAFGRNRGRNWLFKGDELLQKSLEYYRRAVLHTGNNANMCARCAFGFMKLPSPYQDMEQAEKCIMRALELDPEDMLVVETAGMYYKFTNDIKNAKLYFAKAAENGNSSAHFNLIRTKQAENPQFNPLPEFERMLLCGYESRKMLRVHNEMASYLYHVKADFKSAILHWAVVIETDVNNQCLKQFKNNYGGPKLYDIRPTIGREIKYLLPKAEEEEEKKWLESLLALLEPFLAQPAPEENYRKQERTRDRPDETKLSWRTERSNIPDQVEGGSAAFWRSWQSRNHPEGHGTGRSTQDPRTWRTQAHRQSADFSGYTRKPFNN